MPYEDIVFGGEYSLTAKERVPWGSAIAATDCYLDNETVVGRNGYRQATPSPFTVATGVQGLWRFRPSNTSARMVGVVDGAISTITDPSSDTAGDGTLAAVSGGNVFGAGANVSGTQLGKYFYLASDDANVLWRRLKPDYTIETITTLPKGVAPAVSFTQGSLVLFTSLAAPTDGTGTGHATAFTDWIKVGNTGMTAPGPDGGNETFILGTSGLDWSGTGWLAVMVCCPTATLGGHAGAVDIAVASWDGTTTGQFETIGSIHDTPSGPPGSPNLIYCNLNSLSVATRSAVGKKIRFTLNGVSDYWLVYGYYPIYSAPGVGEVDYQVTFYNSTTTQESDPTDTVKVTFTYDNVTPPKYHSVYMNRAVFVDGGFRSLNPDTTDDGRDANPEIGLDQPKLADLSPVATFTGTSPTPTGSNTYDTVRLWRITPTGWRLVKAVAITPGAGYVITDDQGSKVLENQLYITSGTLPLVNTMAAHAGRLVTGYSNRVNISDFVPFGQDTDPFPRFAKIALIDADGWAFDIAPSTAEQIQTIVSGDVTYILTQHACYSMPDLTPGSDPYKVIDRGALGRRSAIYAENFLMWASTDGVYTTTDRTSTNELTQENRYIYRNWLAPTSSCVLYYQERKLYIFQDNRFMRYDFVTSKWTRGTVADNMRHGTFFTDPSSTVFREQTLWMLTDTGKPVRWQSSATSDAGTAIPDWTYISGYVVGARTPYGRHIPQKTTINNLYADCSDYVELRVCHDENDSEGFKTEFNRGEENKPGACMYISHKFKFSFKGRNTAILRRCMFERTDDDNMGGFNFGK